MGFGVSSTFDASLTKYASKISHLPTLKAEPQELQAYQLEVAAVRSEKERGCKLSSVYYNYF